MSASMCASPLVFSELGDDHGICWAGWGVDCAAGCVCEAWHAEVGGVSAAGGDLVHLGELLAGAGQADFQSFGFAEPAG
jgi:hypothetical protein